jgi:hypothetical protein
LVQPVELAIEVTRGETAHAAAAPVVDPLWTFAVGVQTHIKLRNRCGAWDQPAKVQIRRRSKNLRLGERDQADDCLPAAALKGGPVARRDRRGHHGSLLQEQT